MKAEKKVIGRLTKCYALAQLHLGEKTYYSVAAEKEDPCYLFDDEGNQVETLWEGPGGVMTLEQYPGSRPTLLATWKFYSPNNSAEAKIVYYQKNEDGWKCKTLCDLPFVHRFGVLESEGVHYMVACTLKSAHAFKDDWTCPGRIWVGRMSEDLSIYDDLNPLELTPLKSGLLKNHGFFKDEEAGHGIALAGTENGIFKIIPPFQGSDWACELLLKEPASDMLYKDFDGDGEKELLVLAPFHGDTLTVYKKVNGAYTWVYRYPNKLPFLHAIAAGEIRGIPYAFIGCRNGNRELLAVHFDHGAGTYQAEILDRGAGAANCLFVQHEGKYQLLSANRETDEIALYTLEE